MKKVLIGMSILTLFLGLGMPLPKEDANYTIPEGGTGTPPNGEGSGSRT